MVTHRGKPKRQAKHCLQTRKGGSTDGGSRGRQEEACERKKRISSNINKNLLKSCSPGGGGGGGGWEGWGGLYTFALLQGHRYWNNWSLKKLNRDKDLKRESGGGIRKKKKKKDTGQILLKKKKKTKKKGEGFIGKSLSTRGGHNHRKREGRT